MGGPSSSVVSLCHGRRTRHVVASRSRRHEETRRGEDLTRVCNEREGAFENDECKEQEMQEQE